MSFCLLFGRVGTHLLQGACRHSGGSRATRHSGWRVVVSLGIAQMYLAPLRVPAHAPSVVNSAIKQTYAIAAYVILLPVCFKLVWRHYFVTYAVLSRGSCWGWPKCPDWQCSFLRWCIANNVCTVRCSSVRNTRCTAENWSSEIGRYWKEHTAIHEDTMIADS